MLASWQRISITRADWLFFAAAVASLPVWFATSAAAWTVVILILVDLLGLGPTLRKCYVAPHAESLLIVCRRRTVVDDGDEQLNHGGRS